MKDPLAKLWNSEDADVCNCRHARASHWRVAAFSEYRCYAKNCECKEFAKKDAP